MTTLARLLNGEGAFAKVPHILEELTLERVSTRPTGAPHSIFEEVWHIVYWQRYVLSAARGRSPAAPSKAEESWPDSAAPEDEAAWQALVEQFQQGLQQARDLAGQAERLAEQVNPNRTLQAELESLAVHNAYHFGRIVLLRQVQGAWPPPSGGDTW
jgi:uncharacterized damage-inducible protein DinB